ncbi:MAG: hypothetical protein ACRDZ4_20595 [Egibacteraceae bacterium]
MRNRLVEPDGGALARLVIEHECWAEELPPLPEGHAVTVAFSTEDVAAEHAEAVERLGYRVVGVHGSAGISPAADFLVPEALIESHPAWWRALADRADEVYVLQLGPARRALNPALRVHGRC